MTTETTSKDWSEYPLTKLHEANILQIRDQCIRLWRVLTRLQEDKIRGFFPNYPRWLDVESAVEHMHAIERLLNPDRIPFAHVRHALVRFSLEDTFELFDDLWLALKWLRSLLDKLVIDNELQGIENFESYLDGPEIPGYSKFQFNRQCTAELRRIIRLVNRKRLEESMKKAEEREEMEWDADQGIATS